MHPIEKLLQVPFFVFALFFPLTAAVAQDAYRCKVNGAFVYQDQPCANMRQAAASHPSSVPRAAEPVAAANDLDRQKAFIASQEKNRRIATIKDEIEMLEQQNINAAAHRDGDLANLQARKRLANNNLAGATLENSISVEMQAVTERYAADQAGRNERLRALRDELSRIK